MNWIVKLTAFGIAARIALSAVAQGATIDYLPTPFNPREPSQPSDVAIPIEQNVWSFPAFDGRKGDN